MTYGIRITNDQERLLLDADYAVIGPTTVSPMTATAYPSGLSLGDLVVGRPPVGTSKGPFRYDSSPNYQYFILRQSGQISAPISGFGLVVKDSSSNTVFSASSQQKMFLIKSAGILSGVEGLRYPESGNLLDLDKYYVVVNNTFIFTTTTQFGISGAIAGYVYTWVSGTEGYIGVTNTRFYGTNPSEPRAQPFPYMILKEVG